MKTRLFMALHSAVIGIAGLALAAPVTGNGPGGVGALDGSGPLRLWLRSDDLGLSDGAIVSHWPDRSGCANHASGGHTTSPFVDRSPTFRTNRYNGLPTVEFVREGLDNAGYGNHMRTDQTVNTDRESVFTVSHTRTFHSTASTGGSPGYLWGYTIPGQQGLCETATAAGAPAGYDWSAGGHASGVNALRGVSTPSSEVKITSAIRRVGSDNDAIAIWQNGALLGQSAHTGGVANTGVYLVGARGRGGDHRHQGSYDGWMSELIVFTTNLNAAQRILVENALGARYGIALTQNKLYSGHAEARGAYGEGVFGIGRVGAGIEVGNAGTDGFGLRSAGALADGQWIFAGHRRRRNARVSEGVPSGSTFRWARVWYVQNDDGLGADLGFHHADAGLTPPEPDAVYRLLYSEDKDLAFTALQATPSLEGDTVVFSLAAGDLPSGYYTLASDEAGWTKVLRFDAPVATMINARRWDETHRQWHEGGADELYYDAAHRFLLVRFPGCAPAVHQALENGGVIESARLVLTWRNQEFLSVAGYQWRGQDLVGQAPPQWHARVWRLRRPWTDDIEIGPTWNAWVRGGGWWRRGGGLDGAFDRVEPPLGMAPLNEQNPVAEIDVTAALMDGESGEDLGHRLRALEESGFLIARAELSDIDYGDRGLSTGVARTWVWRPSLWITIRSSDDAPVPCLLPPPLDLPALARALIDGGGDGEPSTRFPDDLPQRADAWRNRRRAGMPDWMWNRVGEVWDIPSYWGIDDGYDWFTYMMKALDTAHPDMYANMVQSKVLAYPPGWFAGHSHIEYILPRLLCPEMLPDVVRYHLERGFEARWRLPLAPDKVFSHGKVTGVGTLNHMAQVRPKALLGAEANRLDWLGEMAQFGLSLLNRHMIYSDGFSQEMGDSYYRGITLAPLQAAAKFSRDPLIRLKTGLMVEKLLLEDISTYHPGLRRRVSRISRRAGDFDQYLLAQDVPEAVLHTLSREGALIHLDAPGDPPEVHGMRVFRMHPTPPVRVALMAPWGAEWEANAVDGKPIPFRALFSTRVMQRVQEPIHAMTYMGEHFALASEEVYTSATVPVYAAWRRAARTVEGVEDFGVMFLRGRLNEEAPTWMDKTPFGMLQHDNKLIWAIKTHERAFVAEGHANLPGGVENGLTSFKAQVAILAYGATSGRELYVNDGRIENFPAVAGFGDVIALREGVSYIGLIPLPATDMGRVDEVRIRCEPPFLLLDAYIMDRDEPVAAGDDATWAQLADAVGGWVVEMGDAASFGDFDAFRAHLASARINAAWDGAARVWHLSYESGGDRLELGFRTDWERNRLWHTQLNPSRILAYRRVNDAWPWLPEGVDLDNPLARMGRSAVLEKGGAKLTTREGQMALLRIEPVHGVTVGIHPFIEPTPFELVTPEGVTVRSEGPLGMARVTVLPASGMIRVDYALPDPDVHAGIARLIAERPQWFLSNLSLDSLRRQSARSLRVSGFSVAPRVVLNGVELEAPLEAWTLDGATWWRVPIAAPRSGATRFEAPRTDGGPGGIGVADGTGDLSLWLRAHDLDLADGTAVSLWPDHSGYGNHAVEGYTTSPTVARPPTFRANRYNGLPAVEFTREDPGHVGYGDHMRTERTQHADRESFFVVSHTRTFWPSNSERTPGYLLGYTQPNLQGLGETGSDAGAPNAYDWSAGGHVNGVNALRGVSTPSSRVKITSAIRHVGSGNDAIAVWQNGALLRQSAHTGGVANAGIYLVGARGRGSPHHHQGGYDGWIGEAIAFSTNLHAAQRIVIENHLSAKYGCTLLQNNLYAGAAAAYGDFDSDVFGIGRVDADSQVLNAGSAGFGLSAACELADGEWAFAGHRSASNRVLNAESGGVGSRREREWCLVRTGFFGMTFGFDVSDLPPGIPASAFRLLFRSESNRGWSALGPVAVLAGSTVCFTLSAGEIQDGLYTLGWNPTRTLLMLR